MSTNQLDEDERLAADLRQTFTDWARRHEVTSLSGLTYLLNLTFQVAFLLGKDAQTVQTSLHEAVDRCTLVYQDLVGPVQ